jgi:tRNA A22 N-methylase
MVLAGIVFTSSALPGLISESLARGNQNTTPIAKFLFLSDEEISARDAYYEARSLLEDVLSTDHRIYEKIRRTKTKYSSFIEVENKQKLILALELLKEAPETCNQKLNRRIARLRKALIDGKNRSQRKWSFTSRQSQEDFIQEIYDRE